MFRIEFTNVIAVATSLICDVKESSALIVKRSLLILSIFLSFQVYAPDAVSATTLIDEAPLSGAPIATDYSNPVTLNFDFGHGFSSISYLGISGIFEGDLWDQSEQYGLRLADAPQLGGPGQLNPNSASRTRFDLTLTNQSIILNELLADGFVSLLFLPGYESSFNLSSATMVVTGEPSLSAVPLPPSAILFGTALLGLAGLRRRKRKAA